MNKDSIPWVEKYRPAIFENIILDSNNRELSKEEIDKIKSSNYIEMFTNKSDYKIINILSSIFVIIILILFLRYIKK